MTSDLDLDCPWARLLGALRVPSTFSRHVALSVAWPPVAKFEAAVEMGAAKSGSETIFVEFVWVDAQGPSVFGAEFENAHGQARLNEAHANYRRLSLPYGACELAERIEELFVLFDCGAPAPQTFDRWLLSLKKKH